MVKQQHQVFAALLVLTDAIVVSAACYAAWAARQVVMMRYGGGRDWWPGSWENWIKEPLVLLTIPIAIYALWMFRLYRPRRDKSLLGEQAQILKASLAAVAGLVIAMWLLDVGLFTGNQQQRLGRLLVLGYTLDAARVQVFFLAVALPVLLGVHRWTFRMVLRALRRRRRNLRHVAIIGVGRLGQICCRTLQRNSWTGLNVAYFIAHHDRTQRDECLGRPVHGGLDSLEQTLDAHRVDALYIALPSSRGARLPEILKRLDRYPVEVRVVPDVQPRYLAQSMRVDELDGMPILSYRESPLYGLGGIAKRAIDIAGAAAGLVLFSPVMAVVAYLVWRTGDGPVIFRQRRVSLGGDTFEIYKFRTMYHAEDEQAPGAGKFRCAACRCDLSGTRVEHGVVRCPECGAVNESDGTVPGWTRRDDPRITPVGAWLRRTSLDELPQLLNVLRGDMSLVGPRPERPELIDRFREDWRGYMMRQHVKAGITGYAQIRGFRGQTSLKKRLQYDLYYIQNWSIWLDLRILLATPFLGFINRNAH